MLVSTLVREFDLRETNASKRQHSAAPCHRLTKQKAIESSKEKTTERMAERLKANNLAVEEVSTMALSLDILALLGDMEEDDFLDGMDIEDADSDDDDEEDESEDMNNNSNNNRDEQNDHDDDEAPMPENSTGRRAKPTLETRATLENLEDQVKLDDLDFDDIFAHLEDDTDAKERNSGSETDEGK